MLIELIKSLFFIFLVMFYSAGCCDIESDNSHERGNNQIENMSSRDRTTIDWLIVRVVESNNNLNKTSKTYSSSKNIAGVNFHASLENSQIISLEINDEQVLNTDAIKLHKKFNMHTKNGNFSDQAIWEYKSAMKDRIVFCRIGSIQLSDKGDKCLKISFIISVLDDAE